jgi:death-on-curing protein
VSTEPVWLQRAWVDALHFQQLRRFGGPYGIRDANAIESALARPLNQWAYANTRDLAELAAAYGYGLTRNHDYVDGNKRIGLVAMSVFLELNGQQLEADEADAVRVVLAVAAGEMSEKQLTAWARAHLVPAIP